jgi:acetyl esterase/lipase
LKKSLDQDLLDVIDELSKGWEDLWSREKFKINPKKIVLVGTSFGGPAVLLASRDPRVSKVIVISPVVDWSAPNRDEPLSKFKKFMKEAYGNVYRGKWEKLGKNGFYEPTMDTDGSKVFILHAKDDGVVRIKEVAQFAKKTKSNIKILKIGGHLSTSLIMKTAIWKTISKFLKTTTTISRKS